MKNIDKKKIELGQFFTTKNSWITNRVRGFIRNNKLNYGIDVFAGNGDLLKSLQEEGLINGYKGYDIDQSLNWPINDSLNNVPLVSNPREFIITNPPYLSKTSATRKKINSKYFENSKWDDLYLIALEKCIGASRFGLIIIPETFIKKLFKLDKELVQKISFIETLLDNPFDDTEFPVCIVAWDGENQKEGLIWNNYRVIRFSDLFNTYNKYKSYSKVNKNVQFNDISGKLALIAFDSTKEYKLRFSLKDNVNYDWKNNLKHTSRHYTLIKIYGIDINQELIDKFNKELHYLRDKTNDLILTAFMSNNNKGIRRRRIEFWLARAIINKVLNN